MRYQADGFVVGFSSASLAEANRLLAAARKATPASLRGRYTARINHSRRYGGYRWEWVLIG